MKVSSFDSAPTVDLGEDTSSLLDLFPSGSPSEQEDTSRARLLREIFTVRWILSRGLTAQGPNAVLTNAGINSNLHTSYSRMQTYL